MLANAFSLPREKSARAVVAMAVSYGVNVANEAISSLSAKHCANAPHVAHAMRRHRLKSAAGESERLTCARTA